MTVTVSIMSHLVGILKKTGWKSCQDLSSDQAGSGKERSEYSDLVLARHYENYREIVENIKTRPRLPLPPAELEGRRRRNNKKRKNISWRDRNPSRAASLDHLANMRKCLCPDLIISLHSVGSCNRLVEN